jgi:hypothetical protein
MNVGELRGLLERFAKVYGDNGSPQKGEALRALHTALDAAKPEISVKTLAKTLKGRGLVGKLAGLR